MNLWDIYWADVPFEDNPEIVKKRPVVIAKDGSPIYVLTFKVTSKGARESNPDDYALVYWKESGLEVPSTVRLSKVSQISPDKFGDYIGRVHAADAFRIRQIISGIKKRRRSG